MAVNADWRTYTVVGSFALFAVLAAATGVSWLVGKTFTMRWLKSLAWGVLVFFLAFVLQNIAALFATWPLDQLKLTAASRWIDEPETAIIFALTSALVAYAAFWERFHRC